MFTLKFMQFHNDGTHIETCISCPHYEVSTRLNGNILITSYAGMTMEEGVQRWITKEHLEEDVLNYDCCFVENEEGKTICKYYIKKTGLESDS